MRRVLICAAVVAATAAAPLGAAHAAGADRRDRTRRAGARHRQVQAELVAAAQAGALGHEPADAAGDGARPAHRHRPRRRARPSDRSHVVIGRGLSSKQLAARIAAESDVEYAVADERKHIVAVPNDPLYASGSSVTATNGGPAVGQWYLKPPPPRTASPPGARRRPRRSTPSRRGTSPTGSASIVVAVLDTGIRFDHPDLQGGNVLPGYDMVERRLGRRFTSANDGDGRDADASDPGDFVTAAEAGALGCDADATARGTARRRSG